MITKIYHALVNRLYTFIFKIILCTKSISFGKHLFLMNAMPKFRFEKGAIIQIGNNFTINSKSLETAWFLKSCIVVKKNAKLLIGNNVGINGTLLYCTNYIEIGDYSIIGGGSKIIDTNFHSVDWRVRRDKSRFNECSSAPVTIGSDVFIGTNCIINKGVCIGSRSVIAAGSVVVNDIPADCIAGGNPCKVIKYINQ